MVDEETEAGEEVAAEDIGADAREDAAVEAREVANEVAAEATELASEDDEEEESGEAATERGASLDDRGVGVVDVVAEAVSGESRSRHAGMYLPSGSAVVVVEAEVAIDVGLVEVGAVASGLVLVLDASDDVVLDDPTQTQVSAVLETKAISRGNPMHAKAERETTCLEITVPRLAVARVDASVAVPVGGGAVRVDGASIAHCSASQGAGRRSLVSRSTVEKEAYLGTAYDRTIGASERVRTVAVSLMMGGQRDLALWLADDQGASLAYALAHAETAALAPGLAERFEEMEDFHPLYDCDARNARPLVGSENARHFGPSGVLLPHRVHDAAPVYGPVDVHLRHADTGVWYVDWMGVGGGGHGFRASGAESDIAPEPGGTSTVQKQLVIPALCYVGIGLASIVLLFPQTLNHMFIGAFVDQNLTPILHFLQLQNSILATLPSNHEEWSELAGKALDIRRSHVMGVQGLLGQKGLLELEVSRGRIGPGNLAKIFEKGRELGAKAYGLGSFVMVVEESNDFHRKRKESPSTHPTLRAEKVIQENDDQTSDSGTRLDDLIPLLESSTLPLRQAGEQSLLGLIDFFQEVNQYRWRKPPASKTISRIESLQTLKTALQEYRDSKHFEMLAPFSRLFDPTTGALVVRNNQGIRNLFRAFVMSNNLIAFSLTLIEFSEFVLDIEVKNPKSVFQFPSAFAKMLVESAGDKEGGGNSWDTSVRDISGGEQSNQSQETLVADDTEKQKKNKTTKYGRSSLLIKAWVCRRLMSGAAMDPDASDPRNVFQKFGRKVAAVWGGVTSVEGAFALKYALVSVALWVPQVCPSSAYFVYTNRGLWALIMSQTGLGVFTGEQISSFILRMSGTVVGLVVGMVSWYTGAQLGTGNPYGVAASTVCPFSLLRNTGPDVYGQMVFIAPFLYMRINAPQATSAFWIMSAVTFAFVIGYSWVDEHVFQLANQGAGAALAGRRGLLVIIGFTAGFLIMLFPKPTSAKLLLRRNFAKNITDIGDLYGKEVMVFDVGSHTDLEKKENQKQFRDHFLKIAGRLQGMQPQMGYAQAEPGLKHVFPLSSPVRRCSADDPLLRGPWPVAKYRDMMKVQIRILSAFANLSGAYSRLEPQWCNRLATKSDLLHPAFVADCLSLFALLQNSLRLGQRLPPTMMIFERLAYHRMNTAHHREAHPGVGDDARQEEERIEIETLGKELNWKSCHNEQLAVYATATVALTHITHGLNELHQLVISLVGEKDLDGFDKAQARWARKELAH
ncbi:hypothetical protein P7C73_g1783, partial [Tremellales sp. Uapishka_1]